MTDNLTPDTWLDVALARVATEKDQAAETIPVARFGSAF